MSFKDTIFGSSPSIDTYDNLSPEQRALLNSLISTMSPTVGTGVSSYSGKMYAPISGINTDLFAKVQDLVNNGSPNSDLIQELLSKYSGGYTPEEFNPASVTDLFNKTVRTPAIRSFNEETLPAIAEKLAGRNAFQSGATVYDMTKAGSDLESDLAGQLSSMIQNEKNSVAGRNLTGTLQTNATNASAVASLLGIDEQTLMSILGMAGTAGTTQQNLEQLPFTEAYNKWSTEQPYNNPWLQYILKAALSETTTPVVNPGSSGLLGTLAPALASYAGSPSGSANLTSLLGGGGSAMTGAGAGAGDAIMSLFQAMGPMMMI